MIKKSNIVANNLFNIVYSFLATFGFVYFYSSFFTEKNDNNNLFNFFIFMCFFYVIKNIKKLCKEDDMVAYLLSTIVSIFFVIGNQLENYSNIDWSILSLFKILLSIIIAYPFFNILIDKIINIKFLKIKQINYKQCFLITFFIILFFDFLVFLAIYPGVYGYDAGYQILEFFDKNIALTTHFSIPYCFFLSTCIKAGKYFFKSYEIGFALYSFLQMLFLCYVSTRLTTTLYKKNGSFVIYLLCIIMFSISPLYTVQILSSSVDPFFSGIFTLIVIHLLEMADNNDYYHKKIHYLILPLLIFLLCILRNNGLYVVLLSLPFIIIFSKCNKFITLIIIIMGVGLYEVYSGPVQSYLGISDANGTREMLSIPSQQIARVYSLNNDILSKKDINELKKYYYTFDTFQYYPVNELIADQSKGAINNEYTKEHMTQYINLWSKIFIKDPENYTEAFLLNTLALWYPNKNYYDYRMYHPYIEYNMLDAKKWNPDYISIKRKSKFSLYEKILRFVVADNMWNKIPIISTIFQSGFFFLITIFLICYSISKRHFKYFGIVFFILSLYATIFLGPVVLFRYNLPIYMNIPLIIYLIIKSNRINNENNDNESIKNNEKNII